jgi:class 3 adenylate cyclase/tetratricopeptide (TPR) repeat protein/ABC-type dipeptide/oligopeptide/nickel transport system ATPase component
MHCPQCKTSLAQPVKFCPHCGTRTGRKCPACGETVPVDSRYCSECGANISAALPVPDGEDDPITGERPVLDRGERRHITVLFSDMSNYTALSESHDPEDVRQLLSEIIGRGREIVHSYGGHVERVIGDEILAVFGLPKVHEDDAVRAIKAAQELHAAVNRISASEAYRFDQPINMHTGINSGLVVIDNLSPQDGGQYGISGDAVNLASRLADMADPNEILVGQEAYKQAYGYFGFDRKPTAQIKGKSETICIYAVTKERPRPVTIRRNLGLRASLIGRKAEMAQLHETVDRLKRRQGSIVAIIGEAGTGKSRLVYEFEKACREDGFQWVTGNAYAHTQAIAYYPLINLLRQIYEIEDTQSVDEVRSRIQQVTTGLLGDTMDEIPIIENLYGLKNEATDGMSPEIWQQRLTNTIVRLLSAIASKKPTVFCIEDLHWADTPAVEMLGQIVTDFRNQAILICTFRPPFSLFAGHKLRAYRHMYREIRLGELSFSESQDLVVSLLNAQTMPTNLLRLIRERAEGNPFYLEEMVNALVDAEVLTYQNEAWTVTRDFKETDIPSTIHGVITARLDRLSQPARRVLQEAAVIGRVFLYDLLQRVSIFDAQLDDALNELEQSGLIRPRSIHPEMEMMFKHALIQEVCYSNLLRSERQRVHERIGRVMETLFADRLHEFYETMAMHFKRGKSLEKAVFYLIRSGNKALRRYALETSQRHYLGAKQLAELVTPPTAESQELLVDVLNQWAFVYYYRGRFRDLQKLLDANQPVVESLSDHSRLGMYSAWQGWTLWHRGYFEAAYHKMRNALELGEKADDPNVVGHACTWLAWTSADTGRLDQAVDYADRAIQLYDSGRTRSPYVYFNSLAGKGYACWHRGERSRTAAIGERLLEFGHLHTNVRSQVLGHSCKGWSHLITGDLQKAKACFEKAVQISADPWYARFPKLALGYGFTAAGEAESAEPILQELIEFSVTHGAEFLGTTARFFQELCHITPANIIEKLHYCEQQLEDWRQNNSWLRYVICGHLMARTFFRLSHQAPEPRTKDHDDWYGYATGKAEHWYLICIDKTREQGAVLLQALSWLGMGEYHIASHNRDAAAQAVRQAIELFEACEAKHYLDQARSLLESI